MCSTLVCVDAAGVGVAVSVYHLTEADMGRWDGDPEGRGGGHTGGGGGRLSGASGSGGWAGAGGDTLAVVEPTVKAVEVTLASDDPVLGAMPRACSTAGAVAEGAVVPLLSQPTREGQRASGEGVAASAVPVVSALWAAGVFPAPSQLAGPATATASATVVTLADPATGGGSIVAPPLSAGEVAPTVHAPAAARATATTTATTTATAAATSSSTTSTTTTKTLRYPAIVVAQPLGLLLNGRPVLGAAAASAAPAELSVRAFDR
jgi:hypothetical protein